MRKKLSGIGEVLRGLLQPSLEPEEAIVLLDEFKREVAEEIAEKIRGVPPPVVEVKPEIKPLVELPKVEIPREPLPRPFHSFGADNVTVTEPTLLFKVEGEGLLETFLVVCRSDGFRVRLVVDGRSPVAYDNRTYSEYVLASADDNHLSADYDEVDGETVYKVSIDNIPFWRNCSGYVTPTGGSVEVRLWRANLSYVPG